MTPSLVSLDLLQLWLGTGAAVAGIGFSIVSYFGDSTRRVDGRLRVTAVGLLAAGLFGVASIFGVSREIVNWKAEQEQQAKLDRAADSIEEAVDWIRAQALARTLSGGTGPETGMVLKGGGDPGTGASEREELLRNLEASRVEIGTVPAAADLFPSGH